MLPVKGQTVNILALRAIESLLSLLSSASLVQKIRLKKYTFFVGRKIKFQTSVFLLPRPQAQGFDYETDAVYPLPSTVSKWGVHILYLLVFSSTFCH